MIRKLKTGQYRIYSRKIDPKTRKRKNLGTFDSLEAAQKHSGRYSISSTTNRPRQRPACPSERVPDRKIQHCIGYIRDLIEFPFMAVRVPGIAHRCRQIHPQHKYREIKP